MTQCALISTLTCTRKWREKLDSERWYEHVPKLLDTGHEGKTTILWNQQVQTDKTILNNKQYNIICGNDKRTYMQIDVAISGERNVIKKETEKILKHEDIQYKIQHIWNAKQK